MKRTLCALLALTILLSFSGCCYAPGFEGSALYEGRFMLEPDWESAKALVQLAEETMPEMEPIVLTQEQLMSVYRQPEWDDAEFVNVLDYIPDLEVELKYATTDNIANKKIYEFDGVYLRYGTVVKLMQVQAELREMGLRLKIWDAFRPVSAQEALWTAYPNPTFVANPETGYSSHSRGNTVDITIVDADGVEQEMPTGFDVFTSQADRNYADCSALAAANAQMLEDLMAKYGFTGLQAEWWHFTDDTEYEVETIFDPAVIATWYAECNEYINLRVEADYTSEAIAQIPKDEPFTLLGWSGAYAYVQYGELRGFVNGDYIKSSK